MDPAAPSGVRLAEVPDPVPKPNEALIAVEAVSLNHGELPRSGMFPAGSIPGWDSAGRVIAAAADGTGPKEGTRVVGFGPSGAWAEQRAVETTDLAALPDGVDTEQASTLPVAAGTALRALRALGPIVGRSVLVTGASGGVGRFAVQLARIAGAHAVALVSSAAKRDEQLSAGAHEAVTDLGLLSRPLYGVLENVGGKVLADAWTRLRVGGVLVSIGYASGEPAALPPYSTVGPRKTLISFQLHQAGVFVETMGEDLGYLAALVATGVLQAPIVWRGGWDKLPEALDLLGARKLSGKAVLRVA